MKCRSRNPLRERIFASVVSTTATLEFKSSAGGGRVVIFSVWDPGDQNDPNTVDDEQRVKLLHQGEGVQVRRFGNEGTGGQAFFPLDWKAGERYRFAVSAELVDGGRRTAYTGWLALPDAREWKKLVTFSTLAKGDLLAGYYSFVEDFRRNRKSTESTRRARYGPAWVQTLEGVWTPLMKAKFTADKNPVLNIDAGLSPEGDMFLATGGGIRNETTPLWRDIVMDHEVSRPDLPSRLLSGVEPLEPLDAGAGRLRIMSYNVERGEKTAELAAILHTVRPDLVALQEIDRGTNRSAGRDTLEELALATGMHSAFGKAIDYDGGAYGVAVLSRFPLSEPEIHRLPNEGDLEQRIVMAVEPKLPEGRLKLFVTHLHAGREAHLRDAQASEIARIAARDGGVAIVAGDLNAQPGSETLSILKKAGFNDPVTTDASTIPSVNPNRRIDYVLTHADGWKPAKAFTAIDLAPDSEVWKKLIGLAADHQPTVLEIAFREAP